MDALTRGTDAPKLSVRDCCKRFTGAPVLDAATRLTLREELLQLRREFSCTIVYVTHDQEEALTLSDRVMVMGGGRIRQIDTPENLLRRPADAYVREFVGENILRRQKALERFFRPSEDA